MLKRYQEREIEKRTLIKGVMLALDLRRPIRREEVIVHNDLKEAVILREIAVDKLEDNETRFCSIKLVYCFPNSSPTKVLLTILAKSIRSKSNLRDYLLGHSRFLSIKSILQTCG